MSTHARVARTVLTIVLLAVIALVLEAGKRWGGGGLG
jgi:hypothetical protein